MYRRYFYKQRPPIRVACLTAALVLLCTACRMAVEPNLLELYTFRSGGTTVEFSEFADQAWLTVTPKQIFETDEDGEPVFQDSSGSVLSRLRGLRFLDEKQVDSIEKGWSKKTELIYGEVSFRYYWYEDRVTIEFASHMRSLRLLNEPDGSAIV
jgi:hypothetical protein